MKRWRVSSNLMLGIIQLKGSISRKVPEPHNLLMSYKSNHFGLDALIELQKLLWQIFLLEIFRFYKSYSNYFGIY
ncbi:hypothetical protein J6590_044852 [Homalodisca vitripennis]|nr:hypothetical protein J6590_044852 [Homalodisca vitripennis]